MTVMAVRAAHRAHPAAEGNSPEIHYKTTERGQS